MAEAFLPCLRGSLPPNAELSPASNWNRRYGWGEAVGVGDACCAAFSLSFATFAVACWSRSASFCRFGFGVGVGLTLAASSEREQAPRIKPQESEIVVRKIFMMKSQRVCADVHCYLAGA